MSTQSLTEPGRFVVGCNYWASHAGTAMWRDWRPKVVESDLEQLAAAGLQVLRVFPLWSDFQPLHLLRGGGGQPVEYRHGEDPLPETDDGRAGVSTEAMNRFAFFADAAARNGLELVVGLVTGWMSGRLFVPPAFDGLNVLTDPSAVMWTVRFVKRFVERFRGHEAINAWDLGNECNCMGSATREQAWVWASQIVDAIRSIDPTRPVVSGMHSLKLGATGSWTIADQAELTDVLTTHPYPVFTPHCDNDPVNTMRSCLHATAESRLYADVGAAPCLAEELGTLGPMIAGERVAADYVRTALFSLWAHDCHGLVWWCAYDQGHLEHAPYDWCSVERELGLVRADRSAKPVLEEIGRFRRFVDKLPFDALPARQTEAVCILTEGQDHWAAAYSAFILAKQAGFDVTFRYQSQALPDAPLYLMPSISGLRVMSRRRWLDLLRRVRDGASLYISHADGMLSPFEAPTGLVVEGRGRRAGLDEVTMTGLTRRPAIPTRGPIRLLLNAERATVLGRESDGNPAFTRAEYGKGRVYFLGFPMELELASRPGAFHSPEAAPCWRVYEHLAAEQIGARAVNAALPCVGATEHALDDSTRVVVLINYSTAPSDAACRLNEFWRVKDVLYGAAPEPGASGCTCRLGANDACVFTVVKQWPNHRLGGRTQRED